MFATTTQSKRLERSFGMAVCSAKARVTPLSMSELGIRQNETIPHAGRQHSGWLEAT
ncbi:hypothetical protein [Rhodococcus sp. X156]|uniref:hypothetical protein n=1 Tax=Rhodococcus sp. X156 TaxID=2499145 RepID=UPI0013E40B17|nr:hypothetical protein [Rhodococcus sp. X156]